MMGVHRGPASVFHRNKMNMSDNWNHVAGNGASDASGREDNRINNPRPERQGSSPSDPLIGGRRFHPVNNQDAQQRAASVHADSPISISQEATVETRATTLTKGQERKRPHSNQVQPTGSAMLSRQAGRPKEAEGGIAATGLDQKLPASSNTNDPYTSPHLSNLEDSFDEDVIPQASKRSRGIESTNTGTAAAAEAFNQHTSVTTPQRSGHGIATLQPPPPPAAASTQASFGGPYYGGQQFDHHQSWGPEAPHHPDEFGQYQHVTSNFSLSPGPHLSFRMGAGAAGAAGAYPPPSGPGLAVARSPMRARMPSSMAPPPGHGVVHRRTHALSPHITQTRGSNGPFRPSAESQVPAQLPPRTHLSRALPVGETTSQALHPTQAELAECATPRARQALETWYQRLTELHRFKLDNGHCRVPQQYPQNRQLGVW